LRKGTGRESEKERGREKVEWKKEEKARGLIKDTPRNGSCINLAFKRHRAMIVCMPISTNKITVHFSLVPRFSRSVGDQCKHGSIVHTTALICDETWCKIGTWCESTQPFR
jgi:hypothetical protein